MRRHSARSDVRETKTRKNEWRITKMVLVIFLSFMACYLPITIVKTADKCVNYPGIFPNANGFARKKLNGFELTF